MPNHLRISEDASLALHAMAILSGNGDRRLSSIEIADALHCSEHTLAKVLQRLSKAGLAHSVRGPHGGFLLGKPAHDIRLIEVYEAVEGPMGGSCCLLEAPICGDKGCALGDLVHSVHQLMADFFAKTTLAELTTKMQLQI